MSIIQQFPAHKKPRNPRHSGAQACFALSMGYSTSYLYDLVSGRIHAGIDRAMRIAKESGSPMEIWLLGGDWTKRRPAIEAWHKRIMASPGSYPGEAAAAGDALPGSPPP